MPDMLENRGSMKSGQMMCQVFSMVMQFHGSAIPRCVLFAFPCACGALALKLMEMYEIGDFRGLAVVKDEAAYSSFSLAVGFLFIFRLQQAYERYWQGFTAGHRMIGEWFDASSAILAFCSVSKASEQKTREFEHTYVRLMSLMHASAMRDLSGMKFSELDLIDPEGLDAESLCILKNCKYPCALIFSWVMQLISENVSNEVMAVPPPILSRAYQELASGMVAYHDAVRIQTTEFPFAYAQIMVMLLFTHWTVTPVAMCMWTNWASWVFLFTLVQVLVYWGLFFISVELECPFTICRCNYNAQSMQHEFNEEMLLLVQKSTRRTPLLTDKAELTVKGLLRKAHCPSEKRMKSIAEVLMFAQHEGYHDDRPGFTKWLFPRNAVGSFQNDHRPRSQRMFDSHPKRPWTQPKAKPGFTLLDDGKITDFHAIPDLDFVVASCSVTMTSAPAT